MASTLKQMSKKLVFLIHHYNYSSLHICQEQQTSLADDPSLLRSRDKSDAESRNFFVMDVLRKSYNNMNTVIEIMG